jgi:hypothetical protein
MNTERKLRLYDWMKARIPKDEFVDVKFLEDVQEFIEAELKRTEQDRFLLYTETHRMNVYPDIVPEIQGAQNVKDKYHIEPYPHSRMLPRADDEAFDAAISVNESGGVRCLLLCSSKHAPMIKHALEAQAELDEIEARFRAADPQDLFKLNTTTSIFEGDELHGIAILRLNRFAGDQPPDGGDMLTHVEMKITCVHIMQSS